jgi:hypothetical protein
VNVLSLTEIFYVNVAVIDNYGGVIKLLLTENVLFLDRNCRMAPAYIYLHDGLLFIQMKKTEYFKINEVPSTPQIAN